MHDEHGQRDPWELPLEPFVGRSKLGHRERQLRFVLNNGSRSIPSDSLGVAREVRVLQGEHVRVRPQVAQSLHHGQHEIGGWHAERKALADQSGELVLVLEHVDARHHAAGAVSEQEHRQARVRQSGQAHGCVDVRRVVLEPLDVEAFAGRATAAAEVQRVDRVALGRESLRRRGSGPLCELTP